MTRTASGEHPFYRELVLSVLAMADGWLKAREVSELTGLTYKQTIDALNYLYNAEKVLRTGRKFTAMWGKLELEKEIDASEQSKILIDCFLRGYRTP